MIIRPDLPMRGRLLGRHRFLDRAAERLPRTVRGRRLVLAEHLPTAQPGLAGSPRTVPRMGTSAFPNIRVPSRGTATDRDS